MITAGLNDDPRPMISRLNDLLTKALEKHWRAAPSWTAQTDVVLITVACRLKGLQRWRTPVSDESDRPFFIWSHKNHTSFPSGILHSPLWRGLKSSNDVKMSFSVNTSMSLCFTWYWYLEWRLWLTFRPCHVTIGFFWNCFQDQVLKNKLRLSVEALKSLSGTKMWISRNIV